MADAARQRSDEGRGRTALVTGASAGIGEKIARVFAAHGFSLVLTARRTERLNALADELKRTYGVEAHSYPYDLAQPQSCAHLAADLTRDGIAVDALVNNAGYGVPGLYRETSWETQRDFPQVLVVAPCELTHRLLPGMRARGYGRILNVASVAGFLPGSPSHTLYGAAKSMLIKWSEALHSEEKASGVHVSALCPGFTISEFHDVTGTRAALGRLPKFMWLAGERVAEEGYRAVMRNCPICVPGMQYKAITALIRLLPINAAHRLVEMRSRIMAR